MQRWPYSAGPRPTEKRRAVLELGIVRAVAAVLVDDVQLVRLPKDQSMISALLPPSKASTASVSGEAAHEPVGGLDRIADQLAAEDRAAHLVADVEPPAAALVALARRPWRGRPSRCRR